MNIYVHIYLCVYAYMICLLQVWAMAYMSGAHIYRMVVDYGGWTIDFTTPQVSLCTCIYMYISIHEYICKYIYIYVYLYIYMYTYRMTVDYGGCIYKHIYIYIKYIYICICIYVCIYTYIYMYIYIAW